MKRIKRRTISLLTLVLIIALGMSYYVYRYVSHGEEWATFLSNQTVYSQGKLKLGTVYDRNGTMLASTDGDKRIYSDDSLIRKATLHAVGDAYGNIGTGALSAFVPQLIGYDPINGTYTADGTGSKLYLSIDAELNAAAFNALDGRKGVVAVSNYETGDVICMVSSPGYDPENPPEDVSGEEYEGVYINRFLSSAYTPGSTFKLVTLAAAIDTLPDLFDKTFTCEGSMDVGGGTITCTGCHGELQIEDALAVSCNCAFAQLAEELGGETLNRYAKQLGVTESMSINGIDTSAGNFDIYDYESYELAWSGIGQSTDTVCPAAMLRLMGGIANGGTAINLSLIKGKSAGSEELLNSSTADKIAQLMNYNVYHTYGTDNFPDLELYAKSGTAEVGGEKSPHAWFVGFIKNENHPYAFVVIVENGGSGSQTAGAVANTVLQAAIDK